MLAGAVANMVAAMKSGNRVEFGEVIAGMLRRAGALHVEITTKGIATHWPNEYEAAKALDRFREMGLANTEKFQDKGVWAVFAKFPA